MEELIPLINKLQFVFKATGIEDKLNLPQIVVVGAQSSGKSSVLESFVKKPFLPRGTGMVTRCPIILQLNQIKDGRKHVVSLKKKNKMIPKEEFPAIAFNSRVDDQPNRKKGPKIDSREGSPSPGSGVIVAEEWCQFGGVNVPEKVYTDFDEVRRAIEDLQVEMAGDNKGISKDPIILEVFSPYVIDLTVVDLPGIVKIPLPGQPEDIEDQIQTLIMNYIQNESTIILAVSAANTDIATSESIKLAKKVDPNGDRTIAVVTKLDLMDKGVDAEKLLRGDTIHVKLGIIGVVNRSQSDVENDISIEETLRKEAAFMGKHYPELYSLGRVGSPQLAKTLHKLLNEHIHKSLPDLIARIYQLSNASRMELERLGKEISTDPKECGWLIMKTTGKFIAKFKQLVYYRPLDLSDVDQELFAVDVNKAFKELREEIVFDEEVFESAKISKMLKNTQNYEGLSSIEQVFKARVKQEIVKMELPAVNCAQKIHDLLSRSAGTCFDDPRLQYLNGVIKGAVDELLASQLEIVQTGIKQRIKQETKMIYSSDEDFVRLLATGPEMEEATEASESSGVGTTFTFSCTSFPISSEHTGANLSDAKISHIQTLIRKYLEIVKQELSDYIPKYAMLLLADEIIDIDGNDGIMGAVERAVFGRESALVAEPEDICILRKREQHKLKNLQEAEKIVKDAKAKGLRA